MIRENGKKKLIKEGMSPIPVLAMVNLFLAGVALIKDIALASFMGTTSSADAFMLAFYIPDMIGNTLFASSVGIACIPVFTKAWIKEDSNHGLPKKITSDFSQTTANIFHTVLWSCLMFAILFLVFRSNIIQALGSGLEAPLKKTAERLFVIMLPVVVLYPLVMVGTSVCHVKKKFLLPAFAPVVFNVSFLLGILLSKRFIDTEEALLGIAGSVSLGVVLMMVIVWTNIWRNKLLKLKIPFTSGVESVGSFAATLFPYMIILLIYQSVGYGERAMASAMGTGNISGLNYAYRISQLPVWVFAAAIGTVSFPTVTRLAVESKQRFQSSVITYIRSVFLVILPLSVIINILREPIVSILFSRGSFNSQSVSITTDVLAGYSLAILGQSLFLVGIRFFIAVKNQKIPFFIVLFSTGVNILVDILLKKSLGVAALGYGAAVGGFCNGVLILILLDKKLELGLVKEVKNLYKVIVACIPMGIAALLFRNVWSSEGSDGTWLNKLLYIAGVLVSCAVFYGIPLFLLGLHKLLYKKNKVVH